VLHNTLVPDFLFSSVNIRFIDDDKLSGLVKADPASVSQN
jgi:hypothetical protein